MKLTKLLFETLFEQSYQPIVVINEAGIIEQFNPAAERLFLYSAAETVGKNVNILMGEPHKKNHDTYIQSYLRTHITHNIIGKGREVVAQRKDGLMITIFISVSEAKVDDTSHFIALITNIDEVCGVRKTLKDLATFDILTQTYSRNHFESHAYEWFREYQKNNQPFSLLMLDLDGFKNINDELGHDVGDKVLIAFAKRLQDCLPPHDYLIRLGGDEFLIITQGNYTAANKLAKKLLRSSKKSYEFEGKSITVFPSIGVYAEAEISVISNLLKRTDLALYLAKNSSVAIQFFTPDLEEKFRVQRNLERIIRAALLNMEDFYLVFQPQINLITKKIVGFEVLLRFNYQDQEILPETFIPIIENLGLSDKLNTMILDKLLRLLRKFQWNPNDTLKIAFNLSPQASHFYINLKSLVNKISVFCQEYSNITFEIEITESKLMEVDLKHPKQWSKITSLLREHHVQLAIDDFGREYSSIYRLLIYPVNTLKVDKIFVEQLNSTYQDAAKSILKAISVLGKELNITVVPEGTETKGQAHLLRKLGCTLTQGYYFFRPLPPEEAFALVGAKLL